MTCTEFERDLPDSTEGVRTVDQEVHLKSCTACRGLVSDLNTISQQARLLLASDEPSPRVWNSIELALRREGLIRESQQHERAVVHAFRSRWRSAWLLPVAAALLVTAGVIQYERRPPTNQTAKVITPSVVVSQPRSTIEIANAADDEQLLQVLGERSPAMKAAYEANLQSVNSYIQDAEESLKNNPNDEEAQRYLTNAYEQRAMVYEMALDRSLP